METPEPEKNKPGLRAFARDAGLGVGLYGGCWLITLLLLEFADGGGTVGKSVTALVGLGGGLGAFYLTCALYRTIGDPMGGGDPRSLPLTHRLGLLVVCIALIVPYLWYLFSRAGWI
jgi:hypothetical protein